MLINIKLCNDYTNEKQISQSLITIDSLFIFCAKWNTTLKSVLFFFTKSEFTGLFQHLNSIYLSFSLKLQIEDFSSLNIKAHSKITHYSSLSMLKDLSLWLIPCVLYDNPYCCLYNKCSQIKVFSFTYFQSLWPDNRTWVKLWFNSCSAAICSSVMKKWLFYDHNIIWQN